MNHPAGAPMVEVSEDELTRVYGGGDVQPETTPGVTALTIITLYVPSKLNC
ncbi:mersacidin family lantibiotic [Priestia megaterium]|nr:mersacidin family lantibiotic [Priestia megaterium]MBU8589233.1 mersacidin family lantibiotic [Priestia megaterium]